MLMTYGQQNTNGLLYNLYADKLLQLNLVPEEVRIRTYIWLISR